MKPDPRFDLRQPVRLTSAARLDWPDIGGAVGLIERIHISRRELTVHWGDKGARINLDFDDVEIVA